MLQVYTLSGICVAPTFTSLQSHHVGIIYEKKLKSIKLRWLLGTRCSYGVSYKFITSKVIMSGTDTWI
jgi:hypothetical protein